MAGRGTRSTRQTINQLVAAAGGLPASGKVARHKVRVAKATARGMRRRMQAVNQARRGHL